MAIDVSKIQVGDEITVKGKGKVVAGSPGYDIQVAFYSGALSWVVPVSCIVGHEPAVIKVGDIVERDVEGSSGQYRVLGVDGEDLWLKNERSSFVVRVANYRCVNTFSLNDRLKPLY